MVNPIEFFLAQTNDENKKIADLFRQIFILFREYDGDLNGLYLIATQILSDLKKYPSVAEFGISIAVDEATTIERLLPNEFYCDTKHTKSRSLLTGIAKVLVRLEPHVKRFYYCGRSLELSHLDPLGKDKTFIKYIQLTSITDMLKILSFYFDMSGVDSEKISKLYDHSRRRLIESTVKFIDDDENETKTYNILSTLKKSYTEFRNNLLSLLATKIRENPKIQSALDELIVVSYFLRNETVKYPLKTLEAELEAEETIDLMRLGVVNQYAVGGIIYVDLIHEPIIADACEMRTKDPIVKQIIKQFKPLLLISAKKERPLKILLSDLFEHDHDANVNRDSPELNQRDTTITIQNLHIFVPKEAPMYGYLQHLFQYVKKLI